MCLICAAIPVTAAVGAKLRVDQMHKEESKCLPISKIIAAFLGCLMIASAMYHTFRWQS